MKGYIPENISGDPLLKYIHDLIHEKDMNATFLVLGDVGRGKSTAALFLGETLDPDFNVNRVVFSIEDFFKLIHEGNEGSKLKRGSVIILDEVAGSEEGADSRNALSKTNKRMSYFTTISRAKGWIIIYVCPMFSQLDKRLRTIGTTAIIVMGQIDRHENKSSADWYWTYLSPLSGKILMPKPRLISNGKTLKVSSVRFPLPQNRELMRQYKEKKEAFIDRKIGEWYKEIVKSKDPKEFRAAPVDLTNYLNQALLCLSDLTLNGKLNFYLVKHKFKLTDEGARGLVALLNSKRRVSP